MTLKEKIAARLKAKAAGVNLDQARIQTIVARAEKGGLTDESDDTAIDAQLDIINELTPFTEMASLDDHKRAKAKKDADDKEKADKEAAEKAAKEGKVDLPEDAPDWMKTFMEAQAAQTKALTDQIAAISGEKVITARENDFTPLLKDVSPTYKKTMIALAKSKASLSDDEYAAWLDEAKGDIAEHVQEIANSGLGGDQPAGGAGGNPPKATKVAATEVVDEIMGLI